MRRTWHRSLALREVVRWLIGLLILAALVLRGIFQVRSGAMPGGLGTVVQISIGVVLLGLYAFGRDQLEVRRMRRSPLYDGWDIGMAHIEAGGWHELRSRAAVLGVGDAEIHLFPKGESCTIRFDDLEVMQVHHAGVLGRKRWVRLQRPSVAVGDTLTLRTSARLCARMAAGFRNRSTSDAVLSEGEVVADEMVGEAWWRRREDGN